MFDQERKDQMNIPDAAIAKLRTSHPTHPGQVVTNTTGGGVGIVTEPARRAGIYKGKIGVMWVGGRYEVNEDPADLTVIAADLALSVIGRQS